MADDWRRRLAGSALALVPVGLMTLALACVSGWYSVDAAGRALLTVRSGWFVAPLIYGALAVLIALVVVVCTRVRWRPYSIVVAVAFLVCFGQWGLASMLSMRAPWISLNLAVTGTDGATYRAGGDGDGEYWVVRELDARWDRTVVEIVAGEFVHHASVILPADDPPRAQDNSPLDLRIDGAGRVYVLESSEVLVAYDPRGSVRPPRWSSDDSRAFQRRGMTDAEISPFALLSPGATGDDAGVRWFLKKIATARDGRKHDDHDWAPSETTLLAALDDPNPWIAETARKFVREGGATLYPTATERLPR